MMRVKLSNKVLLFSLLALFVALSLTGCGPKNSEVNVEMTSFAFKLDKDSVPAGTVTFHVKNAAEDLEHELLVIKTDLKASDLKVKDDGKIEEEGLEIIDEIEVEHGATSDLKIDLTPGHYLLICNIAGHFPAGMHAEFTVK